MSGVPKATLWRGDERSWPLQLRSIPTPPRSLWRSGPIPQQVPTVAIVGSRAASVAGRGFAFDLAAQLTSCGFRVISGLARGIDTAALEGALRGLQGDGCAPLALLGNGLPDIYPPENRSLAARIVAAGGSLLSEYPPGTPPRRHHFPRRNRLISGWGLAVVVVEASCRSGSMGTANHALEQGREVCAVPGSVCDGDHDGCHRLIQDGAHLVTCARDVLEVCCGWRDAAVGWQGTLEMSGGDLRQLRRLITMHGDHLPRLLAESGWTAARLLATWNRLREQIDDSC